jgi:hypothetical protein
VVLGVAAVLGSLFGYFFSIVGVFTTMMAFMTLMIGVFNPVTFEKVHHYPHPRPTVEQTVPPTNPEPHHVLVALGTNEATRLRRIYQRRILIQRSLAPSPAQN